MLQLKCGKLARAYDSSIPSLYKIFHLSDTAPIIVPPATNYRSKVSNWPMLDNDKMGDCVIAALLHGLQTWTANSGTEIVATSTAALANYEQYTLVANGAAYNPVNGTGDTGLELNMAASYWMSNGLLAQDNSDNLLLDGQAEVDPADINMVKRAVYEFGGVIIGANLPTSCATEFTNNQPWSATSDAPGSYGMHAMWVVDFDENYFYVITWGSVVMITKNWWLKYVDQVKPLFSRMWLSKKNDIAPSNLNLAALDEQLLDIKGTLGTYARPI